MVIETNLNQNETLDLQTGRYVGSKEMQPGSLNLYWIASLICKIYTHYITHKK
jgi:hypothetical protein